MNSDLGQSAVRRSPPFLVLLALLAFLVVARLPVASAHDALQDGTTVPEWIKRSCCGQADYHQLRRQDVQAMPSGWRIISLDEIIPYEKALPSSDSAFHAFWYTFSDGSHSSIFCFFAPPQAY